MKFKVEIPDRFIAEFMAVSNQHRVWHYRTDADGKRHREYKKLHLTKPWHAVIEMIINELVRRRVALGETDQISVRRLEDDS